MESLAFQQCCVDANQLVQDLTFIIETSSITITLTPFNFFRNRASCTCIFGNNEGKLVEIEWILAKQVVPG